VEPHSDEVVDRILLSGPDVGDREREALLRAFDSGWIAPVGLELDAFEEELREYTGAQSCVAISSGSAALHLALLAAGVVAGDEVVVQSATFAASAFAVAHVGAVPVFMDSEASTWCLDPALLRMFLESRAATDQLPAAVMPVDLYGSVADYAQIVAICAEYGVPLVRDAAEALGSESLAGKVGEIGALSALSFNGNKIITTSSGGALLGDEDSIALVRHLATQARQPALHYEHLEIGFNYRMSNLLAALGRAQLEGIEEKIAKRAAIARRYAESLPELTWCPYAHTTRPNRWLAVGLLPGSVAPEQVCRDLQRVGIEARPAWKPMHQQPVFEKSEYVNGDGVADDLYSRGICLPSGSTLSGSQIDRVIASLLGSMERSQR